MAYLFLGAALPPIVMLAGVAWRAWRREKLDPANACDRASARQHSWH
jgi:hypothetical protein